MEAKIATYDAEVRVVPREGILDPEGETVRRALGELGYEGVRDVHAGRLFRIRMEASEPDEARRRVEAMCEELIANPVIEDYEIRVREAGGEAP